MPALASACRPSFRCAGCGAVVQAEAPFHCPAARRGDDIDHVVVRVRGVDLPTGWEAPGREGASREDGDANPFQRFGHRLSASALARSHGWPRDRFGALVRRLDQRVAEVDGHGFVETPCEMQPALAKALAFEAGGALFVKNETGNVSGSHKARHLAGIMLYLEVLEATGLMTSRPALAIASCGNAALAAAVIAKAAAWPLQVFVPPTANPAVLSRLDALGGRVHTCRREPGVAGDPCYLAFRRAVDSEGAIPFCCQGSDNGLTIEGGETLAWEIVEQLAAGSGQRAIGGPSLDAVFVQVGGGALASAVIQGFETAHRPGVGPRLPALYAVQTSGAYPLARAYEKIVGRIQATRPDAARVGAMSASADGEASAEVAAAMAYARRHRSSVMWAWEEEPRSVAHGILDDETYDWAAVVEGMLHTAGRPVVVGEGRLQQANDLARRTTGIDVDHTGSAGLAGLMELIDQEPALRRQRVAVIFSGVRR